MAKAKANLFTQAKANPVKKAGPAQAEEVVIETKELEAYAFLDTLEKQAASLKKTLKPSIETQMTTQFILNRGENYKGKESTSSGSLECRKRSSTSGFKPHELELIELHNIPTKRIEGDFTLNIEGVSADKLQEVSDAIAKVKGLPDNFIEFDASKARTITTEESIKSVFLINDVEVQRTLLPVVATYAIKAKTSSKLESIIAGVAMQALDNDDLVKLAKAILKGVEDG